MVSLCQCGVSEQEIAGLMDMLMAQGTASAESKFLALEMVAFGGISLLETAIQQNLCIHLYTCGTLATQVVRLL